MISIATLAGSSAAGYYLHQQGCEHEVGHEVGYYLNGHDAAGRWLGSGATALSLSGPMARDSGRVLEELLDGRFDGEQLVAPVWRRDEHGDRVDVRRAGFDVTFSAPKSVSVLMALAGPDVATHVVRAHQAAVNDALALLEQLAARAARGHHGDGLRARRIRTSGLVAAGFEHTTSRANDPQLHTHVVIANLAKGVDGRWSALDSRALHREATTASYLYQHRLRAELTSRLGVSWSEVERGVAEIDGVPLSVRRLFSTRRRQIELALNQAAQGRDQARRETPEAAGREGRARQLAARLACLRTRPAKTHEEPADLRASWRERAGQLGFGPDQLEELLTHTSPARAAAETVDLASLALRVLAADGVTRESATFAHGVVLRELIGSLPAGAQVSTAELLAAVGTAMQSEEVLPVLNPDGPAFTTRAMLRLEREVLTLAERGGPPLAQLDASRAASAVARTGQQGLRGEQQRAALTLLRSGRPVDVLTGPAGCGKTAALGAATKTWQAAGVPVAGTAVAALTAQGLQDASGAPSVSLARLLHHPDEHLPASGVLLVDEAGMVGTRQLHRVLSLAAGRGCKVVLVGDASQLPELEAGGLFARLAEAPGALRLEGHARQQQAWERSALAELRAGHVDQALAAYTEHGRLHAYPDREALHEHAITNYVAARQAQQDPWQVVLLASGREEVQALNDGVRQRLLATRVLSAGAIMVDTPDRTVSYRVGDQVLVTRNDHLRGLLNGTAAIVTHLDGDGLTLSYGRGQQIHVDRAWLAEGRLDHGYAMTIHKAQGRTVHTALLVGDATLSAQAGYVGLSRGTQANHLFLRDDVSQLATDCGARVQYARTARAPAAAAALRRDARQRLASEYGVRRQEGRSR